MISLDQSVDLVHLGITLYLVWKVHKLQQEVDYAYFTLSNLLKSLTSTFRAMTQQKKPLRPTKDTGASLLYTPAKVVFVNYLPKNLDTDLIPMDADTIPPREY